MSTTVATPETTEHVTIFFADWCPFCAKLIKNLDLSLIHI